jgi:hypothetical protein
MLYLGCVQAFSSETTRTGKRASALRKQTALLLYLGRVQAFSSETTRTGKRASALRKQTALLLYLGCVQVFSSETPQTSKTAFIPCRQKVHCSISDVCHSEMTAAPSDQ